MNKYENFALSKTDAKIIKCLLVADDFLTTNEISIQCNLSQRMVRSEIPQVKEILSNMGIELISKRSKGYRITDRGDLSWISTIMQQTTISFDNFLSHEARGNALVEILFANDDHYIKMDDLAEMLYVSRSTIKNQLTDIIENGQKYHISYETKPRFGIRLTGTELSKRRFVLDSVFNLFSESDTLYQFLDLFLSNKNHAESKIVLVLEKNDIYMSDIALVDFLLYVTFMIQRISERKYVERASDDLINRYKNSIEVSAAGEISSIISKWYEIRVPENEIFCLGIMIIAKRSTRGIQYSFHPEAAEIAAKVLQSIYVDTRISLTDYAFRKEFETYIYQTMNVLRLNEKVRNPLYLEVKKRLPHSYTLAKITSNVFEETMHIPLSLSHLAYYATLFDSVLLENTKLKVYNTLLICGYGRAASSSVCYYLHKRIGDIIHVTDMCAYYQLPNYNLDHYDLAISTIPVQKHLPIPVVNISMFATQEDIQKIVDTVHADYRNIYPEMLCDMNLFQDHVKAASLYDLGIAAANLLYHTYRQIPEATSANAFTDPENHIITNENDIALVVTSKSIAMNSVIMIEVNDTELKINNEGIRIFMYLSLPAKRQYIADMIEQIVLSIKSNEVVEYLNHFHDYAHFIDLLNHGKQRMIEKSSEILADNH